MNHSSQKIKTIFFFFNKNDVELALNHFGKKILAESKCFAINIDAYQKLTQLKITSLSYQNYFPKKRAEQLNLISKKWATGWYRKISNQDTWEIFSMLDLSLYNYFAKKLFQYFAIKELIKGEKPTKIYLGKETSGIKDIFITRFELITPIIKKVAKENNIRIINFDKNYLYQKISIITILKLVIQFLKFPFISVHEFKKRKIDFLILGHHYHLKNILSFIKELDKNKLFIIGRLGNIRKELVENNFDLMNAQSSLNILSYIPFLKYKIKFLISLLSLDKNIFPHYFKIEKITFYDLFKIKICSAFVSDAITLLISTLQAEKILKSFSPNILINLTEDTYIRGFINNAKRAIIPTLEIQHGITVGHDSEFTTSGKFAVWGKIPKSIYAKTGLKENRMVITGWPAYEIYKSYKQKAKKINPKKFQVTFLTQDPGGASFLFMTKTPEENLEIFFRSIASFKNQVKIVVRLHPRADTRIPIIIAKKYNVMFRLSKNETLLDLLTKTDIIVGQTTSATLDAIIMNKPVIYLSSMEWPSKFVEGSGAVFEVNNSDEITDRIKLIIKNGISNQMIYAQKEFIENYCNFSKNSTKLITDLINKMTKKKNYEKN